MLKPARNTTDTSRPPVHDAQPAARVSTYRCVSRSGCVSITAGGAPPKRDPCPEAGNEGDKKTGMIPAYGCAGSRQAYPSSISSTTEHSILDPESSRGHSAFADCGSTAVGREGCYGPTITVPFGCANAVIRGVQVQLVCIDRAGNESERTVHPLGLVARGAQRYLVAHTETGQRKLSPRPHHGGHPERESCSRRRRLRSRRKLAGGHARSEQQSHSNRGAGDLRTRRPRLPADRDGQ